MGSHLQMWYHLQMWAHRQMVYQPGVPTLIPPSNRVPFLKAPPPSNGVMGSPYPECHTPLFQGVFFLRLDEKQKKCVLVLKNRSEIFFLKMGQVKHGKTQKAQFYWDVLYFGKKNRPQGGVRASFFGSVGVRRVEVESCFAKLKVVFRHYGEHHVKPTN